MGKKLLGFDFGDHEIKIAVCKDNEIQRFVTSQTPDNLINDARIISFNAMADHIKEMIRQEHISGRAAVVSLPMSSCFVRRVHLPLMKAEQLKVNLPFEFRDYITGEVDNYVFDYTLLSQSEDGMELIAAATPKEVMLAYKHMMKRAGLKLVGLVPEVLGIQALLARNQTGEKRDYAVLDMGHGSTRLHFFSQGAYEITHTMEYGGRQAAGIVAEEKGVDIHIAQLYLDHQQDDVLDLPAISDLYEGIATEIMRNLNFYSYNNPENSIDCLYYFGSGLSEEKLMMLVGQMTGLPTIPLVRKIENGETVDALSHGPQAYGIAAQNKTLLNLLVEEKHVKENVRAIVLFLLFMAALMVFVKCMVVDKITQINHMAQAYVREEASLNTMRKDNSIYEQVRAEYSHYGSSYLHEEEAGLQDRMHILNVIEKELLDKDALQDIQITGNVASLTINSGYLSNVSQIVAQLEDEPIVEYVTVSTAQSDDSAAVLAESAARMEREALGTDSDLIDEEQESVTEAEIPPRKVVTTMTIYFCDARLTGENEGETEYAE